MLLSIPAEDLAETKYELEQAKKNYPDQEAEARRLDDEIQTYFLKKKKQ
jgi:hypothetical protein